ncbi:MerR family transcriptional regulator [Georgenia faecalis]|uniref:MerR family transcriptional regulator n=1 Tax=Georgenia faecalis TaxID=2483799 RepID=A0ABV9D628_9MICO|nr:MerR family transcriptional regulator [Georgenia faecalis]
MTATKELTVLTVGQVAERFDVTVRTLHHYDEIGVLSPTERSAAGYRLYTDTDLTRLQHVVVYRRLGFPLEAIAELLDGGAQRDAVVEHLRRQKAAVMSRLDEMQDLVTAIDRALEQQMNGINLTPEEQKELFGDGFKDEYAVEAQDRWGDTEAWQQSQGRTAQYTKADWEEIAAETGAINAAYVAALEAGLPASSDAAMDAAERARVQIHERFYDITPEFHRCLGDMYIADERFTKTYEDIHPGLAQYVRDAIHANADRQAGGAAS